MRKALDSGGFTLIEMLLSIAILTLLAGLSLPVYASFANRNDVDVAAQTVAESLRRAETFSRGSQGDSQWGVKTQAGSIVLFKGTSYAARDSSFDESTTISSSITLGGLSEVVFSKLTGAPASTGNITLTTVNNDTRTVSLNAQGMVSY